MGEFLTVGNSFQQITGMYWSLIYLTLIFYANAAESPVIGVLTQESYLIRDAYSLEIADSFIAASNVKLLESAGARVMPIWIGQDSDYYEKVVKHTNGILFPGGGTYFNETGGYGEAALKIYDSAVKINKAGVHYPIFGICLGLQVFGFAAMGGKDIRVKCTCQKQAMPLKFISGYKHGRMYSDAPEDLLDNATKQNITYNNHIYCLTEDVLSKNGLLKDWRIITVNEDHPLDKNNTVKFISSMEHVTYPFYAVQYHPEKNCFEFKDKKIPHSYNAIRLTQYVGDFFVQQCTRNNNTLPKEIEDKVLIYNYNPVYSVSNTPYEQVYLFKETDRKVLF